MRYFALFLVIWLMTFAFARHLSADHLTPGIEEKPIPVAPHSVTSFGHPRSELGD